MELAYSGLHQLCAPMLGQLDGLPTPQRDALGTVFGQQTGPAPDRFLVALAALTLLAEVAERQPLLCVIDDAQWLDTASAQIMLFVGRRLLAEPIASLCAARSPIETEVLVGLPELRVGALGAVDTRALLMANLKVPFDAAVSEQIVTESHGNPLALLELPRTWNIAEVAGGFGLPARLAVAGKIERSYATRLVALPARTQLLALAAAAEPLGDPLLLLRAGDKLGFDMADAGAAVDAGLLEMSVRISFAHPLVRSAAYESATDEDRHWKTRREASAGPGSPGASPSTFSTSRQAVRSRHAASSWPASAALWASCRMRSSSWRWCRPSKVISMPPRHFSRRPRRSPRRPARNRSGLHDSPSRASVAMRRRSRR